MGYVYIGMLAQDTMEDNDHELHFYAYSSWSTHGIPDDHVYVGLVENKQVKIGPDTNNNYGGYSSPSTQKINLSVEFTSSYWHIFCSMRRLAGENLAKTLGILDEDDNNPTSS